MFHLQGFSPYLSVWSLGSRCHIMIFSRSLEAPEVLDFFLFGIGSTVPVVFCNWCVSPPWHQEKKTPPPFFGKKEKKQLGAVDCQSDRPQLVGGVNLSSDDLSSGRHLRLLFLLSGRNTTIGVVFPWEGDTERSDWVFFFMFCWCFFLMKNKCFIFVRNFEIITQIPQIHWLVVF